MKITRSAVYKMTVAADCGCSATGDYADPNLTQLINKHFDGCAAHGNSDAVGSILMEVVDKEAAAVVPKVRKLHPEAIGIEEQVATVTPVQPHTVRSLVERPTERPAMIGPNRPRAVAAQPGERPPSPFRRIAPGGTPAPKTHTASTQMDLGEPEDYRVTALIEETGLLVGPDDAAEIG